MKKAIAVLGSSRSDGNTRRVLDAVIGGTAVEILDLSTHPLTPYDYQHRNSTDFFLAFAARMTEVEVLILGTPVYWYSMSAQLKLFFDRLSDLITIRKDLGRALAGRHVYAVTSSPAPALPNGFEAPFELTCEYFGMCWGGCFHGHFLADDTPAPGVWEMARAFGEDLLGRGCAAERGLTGDLRLDMHL